MLPLRRFLYKFKNLVRRSRAEEELQREVRSHLALLEHDFESRNLTAEQAQLAARRAYGSVELAKELQRDERSWIGIDRFLQDLRYAIRSLRKTPMFSAVLITTLALGIGSNTAIFSIVDKLLLHPLPYPDSNSIMHLGLMWKNAEVNDTFDVPQYEFFRDHSSVLKAIAGYRPAGTVLLKTRDTQDWVSTFRVTDGFFTVFGIHPAFGRDITREETRAGSAPVAILSDPLWRRAFRADPAVVGRQIRLNEAAYTVVGVMPPGYLFLEQPTDVIVGLQLGRSIADTGMNTHLIARLRSGDTMAQAQANLNAVFAAYRRQGLAQSGQGGVQLEPYQKWLAGDLRTSVLILSGAVALLLLIACANVAGLLIARSSARSRELSIRLAVGSGRGRLLQQFLVESLVLASAGAVAGVLAAMWTLKLLLPVIPWQNAMLSHVTIDYRALLFAGLLALGTTVVFGFTSYWQISEANLNDSLKEKGPAQWQLANPVHARSMFIVAEIALSAMLLVGAGLLIDTLFRLHQQKLGFDPDRVYTMQTPFERQKERSPAELWMFEQQVLRQISSIPGVHSAAVVSELPLTGPDNLPTEHDGHPEHSIGGMEYRAISSQYFQTIAIPVLQGRGFQETDSASSAPVAIVSESVARAWWSGRSPIGDRIVVGEYRGKQFPEVLEQPREVVGVVADVKNLSIDERNPTTVYVPAAQLPRAPGGTAWVVKANAGLPVGKALRAAVLAVNPDQRIQDSQPLSDIVANSVARPTFNAFLMSTFAALALILTGVGVYGLLSYQVQRRTQEIGIRVALGAKRTDVVWMIVKRSLVLTTFGILIGASGAFVVARILSAVVPGVRANEPGLYVLVLAVLFCAALIASYLPARRASGIDPAISLRYDW